MSNIPAFRDLSGQRFGMLVVLHRDNNNYVTPKGETKIQWVCKCDCGSIKSIVAGSLLSGRTQSCGQHNKAWNKGMKLSSPPIYEEHESYMSATLPSGECFIFDKDDFEKVKQYNWFVTPNGYIKCGANIGTQRFLHRMLMCVYKEEDFVDHINHNMLDNRKCNLRVCTNSQNVANSCATNSSSKKRGVTYSKKEKRWIAYIRVNKKNIRIGSYDNLSSAIRAREEAEDLYFGEFSYANSRKTAEKNGVCI